MVPKYSAVAPWHTQWLLCQEHSNSVLNSVTLTHLCALGQPLPFSSVFPLCSAGVDRCSQPRPAVSAELSVWEARRWALEISPVLRVVGD